MTGIDDEVWARLKLATLQTSGGTLDWAHAVAERVQRGTPSTTTLAIFDELIRHSEHETRSPGWRLDRELVLADGARVLQLRRESRQRLTSGVGSP